MKPIRKTREIAKKSLQQVMSLHAVYSPQFFQGNSFRERHGWACDSAKTAGWHTQGTQLHIWSLSTAQCTGSISVYSGKHSRNTPTPKKEVKNVAELSTKVGEKAHQKEEVNGINSTKWTLWSILRIIKTNVQKAMGKGWLWIWYHEEKSQFPRDTSHWMRTRDKLDKKKSFWGCTGESS